MDNCYPQDEHRLNPSCKKPRERQAIQNDERGGTVKILAHFPTAP